MTSRTSGRRLSSAVPTLQSECVSNRPPRQPAPIFEIPPTIEGPDAPDLRPLFRASGTPPRHVATLVGGANPASNRLALRHCGEEHRRNAPRWNLISCL